MRNITYGYVYCLIDKNGKEFYIGRTINDIKKRAIEHIRIAKSNVESAKCKIIIDSNFEISYKVLKEFKSKEVLSKKEVILRLNLLESYYIKRYVKLGKSICNIVHVFIEKPKKEGYVMRSIEMSKDDIRDLSILALTEKNMNFKSYIQYILHDLAEKQRSKKEK